MVRPSIALALATCLCACGGDAPPRDPGAIRIHVVDTEGNPATWAQVLLGRRDEQVASKWIREKATLVLPREHAPHRVRIAALGHRLLVLDNVRESATVTLPRGFIVQVQLADGPTDLPEPRAVLFRIRPELHGDPATDRAAQSRIQQLCEMMFLVKGQEQGSLPVLPTKAWGYGVSPTDAANGFYVPVPGTYVVHWGLLDLDEGTWFCLDSEQVAFTVKEQGEPQVVSVRITPDALRRTDEELQRQIDAIHAAEAKAKKAAASDADATEDEGN